MDVNKLDSGEKLSAVAGIALFVLMFFSWYGVDVGEGIFRIKIDADVSAWQAYDVLDLLMLVTCIAAVGFAALKASGKDLELPITPSLVVGVLGGLSALTILYRIIDAPDLLDPKLTAYLGFFSAVLIGAGGFLTARTAQSENQL